MVAFFSGLKKKELLVSAGAGLIIFIITWCYINSYYTLSIEDSLLSREIVFIHNLTSHKPKINRQFVFINTGKDLNLIDDTAQYGNISVTDRYKLFRLLNAINKARANPKFLLLDLQFYYPYKYSVDDSIQQIIKKSNLQYFFPDKSVDDSLANEIRQIDNSAISILLVNNKIQMPIYKGNYGVADYKTYGSFLNKFKLYYNDLKTLSIPALMHSRIDGADYTGSSYATFCNNRLCFNYIWPDYYYNEKDVKADTNYHLGSLLPILNDLKAVKTIFKNKIVFIGNFEGDVLDTPNGKIPGTIILADIYLSLLNGKHYLPYLWVVFMFIAFTALSYVAIYNQFPEVKFKIGFVFAPQISGYLQEYVSYLGILLLLSLLSIFLFDITISLFLPALIFSTIDFFTKEKYKPKQNEKD
jgi:hypothetical protein